MGLSDEQRYIPAEPPIVRRAIHLAESLGFPLMPEGRPIGHRGPASACIPAVGRTLRMLAASKPGGRIGEQGTGSGVGTAWLASGMDGEARLVSAERDPGLVESVAPLFAGDDRVSILQGEWQAVLASHAPFDLLFMDADARTHLESVGFDAVTDLVKIGGMFVFDDLVPVDLWPTEWSGMVDVKREFAFRNPRVTSVDVRTTPITSMIIATRIS